MSFFTRFLATKEALCLLGLLQSSNPAIIPVNRYEDERLAESRYASFTDKKERKLLASDNRHKKMDTCMQKARKRGYGNRRRRRRRRVNPTTICPTCRQLPHQTPPFPLQIRRQGAFRVPFLCFLVFPSDNVLAACTSMPITHKSYHNEEQPRDTKKMESDTRSIVQPMPKLNLPFSPFPYRTYFECAGNVYSSINS